MADESEDNMSYPKCARSFLNFCLASQTRFQTYGHYIVDKHVRAFDVTLRDGLQGLSSFQQSEFNMNKKIQLYREIQRKFGTNDFEVGSCVNYRVLPIFKDTREVFQHVNRDLSTHNYVLVPNETQLIQALNFGVSNFSFITSVSNSFQLKNTKKTLVENFAELLNMMYTLDDYRALTSDLKVKLYISCVNECPIEGRLDNKVVVEHIVSYRNRVKPDKICLSDTCGTLTSTDFLEIIHGLQKNQFNFSTLSLHLHVREESERELEVEKIVHMALDHGIVEFDVSHLASGGCSVTMAKEELAPNLSYAQYYKFLTTYLMQKTN